MWGTPSPGWEAPREDLTSLSDPNKPWVGQWRRYFSTENCSMASNSREKNQVKIEIAMHKSVLNCSLTPTQGKYSFDPVSETIFLKINCLNPQTTNVSGEQAALLGCGQDRRLKVAKSSRFSQPHYWGHPWTYQPQHQVNIINWIVEASLWYILQFSVCNLQSVNWRWVVWRWTDSTCMGRSTSRSRGWSTSPRLAGSRSGCDGYIWLLASRSWLTKTVIISTWIYVMPSFYTPQGKCIYCPPIFCVQIWSIYKFNKVAQQRFQDG